MVQSGLKEELLTRPEQPRVSPYRMAFHWLMALGLYGSTLWLGLSLLLLRVPITGNLSASTLNRLRKASTGALHAAAITLASGPFVAGNDAGRAFNRWPLMTETSMVPDEVKSFVNRSLTGSVVSWREIFEDTAIVQFIHRSMAYLTVASALGFGFVAKAAVGKQAGPLLYWAVRAVPAVAVGQMLLGIATLLNYVPTDLALAHQAGGLAVFTSLLVLRFLLRMP
jgi:cytochrome c oxidase assembly protein subunit 15